jgi:hypothetical protein
MNQAEVKKHIATGTPLAVIGKVSETPSNFTGKFVAGSRFPSLEDHTRAVPVEMGRRTVSVWVESGRWGYHVDRDLPAVRVRIDDGTEGWVTPRSITGTWDQFEAAREAVRAKQARDDERESRLEELAEAIGGTASGRGVLLSAERAEELAELLGVSSVE